MFLLCPLIFYFIFSFVKSYSIWKRKYSCFGCLIFPHNLCETAQPTYQVRPISTAYKCNGFITEGQTAYIEVRLSYTSSGVNGQSMLKFKLIMQMQMGQSIQEWIN